MDSTVLHAEKSTGPVGQIDPQSVTNSLHVDLRYSGAIGRDLAREEVEVPPDERVDRGHQTAGAV